jgi:3-oxoacyl-[acyl-carrier protein] reductase
LQKLSRTFDTPRNERFFGGLLAGDLLFKLRSDAAIMVVSEVRPRGRLNVDFGIKGRKALVCASSRGLGKSCAIALAREGVEVTLVARTREALEITTQEIRDATDVPVGWVVGDITTDDGRNTALEACPQPDILVNNAGGPPTGDFRDWDRAAWIKAIDANMLSAIFLIRAVLDGMVERRFGRIVNITSAAVKAPTSVLGLSTGARSGLTGFVAGLARERDVAANNVTINNLLPGAFDTDRLRQLLDDDARQVRLQQIPAARFGNPDEFGQLCAYLCSAQAGYLTGQNILIDGGAYRGTF